MIVRAALLSSLSLLCACASFREPAPFDPSSLDDRAVSAEGDGFRARAALLTPEETESIFGLDLDRKGIQPVWLEIENGSAESVYLFVSAIDPEYFAPLEVAHAFHRSFSKGSNARLDEFLAGIAFPKRKSIHPGITASGFVFTNRSGPTKVVDLDLLGEEFLVNLTLFVKDPASERGVDTIRRIEERFSASELVRIEDEEGLRAAMEGLPCCVQDEQGEHVAPLNLVVVGELDQWVSGFWRRRFAYEDAPPLYAFQRPQDGAVRKQAQWVDAQAHIVRLWQTPIRYRSIPVWLGQASSPRGGRFASDLSEIDPDTDRARIDVLADLLYSQGLAQVGFVRGAGCPRGEQAGIRTDGLRVLMLFTDRAISLAEIDFLDWERLADPR